MTGARGPDVRVPAHGPGAPERGMPEAGPSQRGREDTRMLADHRDAPITGATPAALDRFDNPTEDQLKSICVDESQNPQND